jgi:hypothetical protein
VQALTGFFVDYCREHGAEPARDDVGHVARQLKRLAAQGFNDWQLRDVLRLLVDRNLSPSTLPSLMREVQLGPRQPTEHPTDQLVRGLLGGRPGQ